MLSYANAPLGQWASGLHSTHALHTMQSMEAVEHSSNTTLTIRNVDRRLKERLRVRAAQHGQSMEAELRQILRETLEVDQPSELNLAEAIRRRLAPLGGVELEAHPPVVIGEPPAFEL